MGQVIWSRASLRHLQAVHEYIAQDSPTWASRFCRSLIERVDSTLRAFPRSGRAVPEFGEESLREVLYRSYRIIYRADPNSPDVTVLAVMHGSRLLDAESAGDWDLE